MQERPLVRNGKTILSGIDPVRRAERLANSVPVQDRTLYFCPSVLYGYGLDKLLTRLKTDAPNSMVLCVEADPELYELTLKNITPSLTENKQLHITNVSPVDGLNAEKLCTFVRRSWSGKFRKIETVRFSGGWQLFPELYDLLYEALQQDIVTDWSNAIIMTKLGRLYMRNALRNLPLIGYIPSLEKLSFGEAPVLVLGAGPSLDETLDTLVKLDSNTKSFKIICADTCLAVLKDRNITPDLVVILESQHWNLHDFIGCRGWKVPAAFDFSALPQSGEVLGGEKYLFMTPWTSLSIFDRLNQAKLLPAVIPPLGSVGLTAVEIARRLTSGKIICAGLDFSFTTDKYHARSTPGHLRKLNTQTRFGGLFNNAAFSPASFPALSKSGIPVRSNPVMQNYRNLFEREFAADERIFDLGGSGLALGLKTLPLSELQNFLTEKNEGTRKPDKTGSLQTVSHESQDLTLRERVTNFIEGEKNRLITLRDILSGKTSAAQEDLGRLINECDYLWAHFPDCAAGQKIHLTDTSAESTLSFLKRVSVEITPALALFER